MLCRSSVLVSLLCLRCLPLPPAAPLSARGGVRLSRAHSAHCAPSPARLPAPALQHHGSGKGEVGHQHHYGRGRIQPVDRAHSVKEREGVRGAAGPRPKRRQCALEGNVCGGNECFFESETTGDCGCQLEISVVPRSKRIVFTKQSSGGEYLEVSTGA